MCTPPTHKMNAQSKPPRRQQSMFPSSWVWFGTVLLAVPLARARPNFIVMQPDDFEFLAHWNPPAHLPGNSGFVTYELPNLERLYNGGVTMERAYTTSPMCGTSRYSTLTGRYPSRSSYSRQVQTNRMQQEGQFDDEFSRVIIGNTKLMDVSSVSDGYDCSESNIAALLQRNGYATGVVGKWHLGLGRLLDEPYEVQQETIRACGFDTAEAIYWENLFDADGGFLHNMEHVTDEAIRFIDRSRANNQDFFLYFNPTAPHASGSVYDALTEYSCRDTPGGRLARDPIIRGMTAGRGCRAYRDSIVARAQGDRSNAVLGSIWVDDAIGALVTHLESFNQLDNTFFLFQLDHGKEGKASLYEPGIRIAQFVHYPNAIQRGSSFGGLVSTIDIAPTIAEYAGIGEHSRGWFQMDGWSWKHGVETRTSYNRCMAAEMDRDRAFICDCEKILTIGDSEDSRTARRGRNYGLALSGSFQLCDANAQYITSPYTSPEVSTVATSSSPAAFNRLNALQRCHKDMTHPWKPPVYGTCDRLQGIPPPVLPRTYISQPSQSFSRLVRRWFGN